MITRLRELGTTILLTTHYMEEAQALADRVVVVVAGRIVADATPETLGGRDQAAATVRFRTPAGLDIAQLPALRTGRVSRDGDHVVVASVHQDDLCRLLDWARDRELELASLTVERPTLEDVYLALTGGVR